MSHLPTPGCRSPVCPTSGRPNGQSFLNVRLHRNVLISLMREHRSHPDWKDQDELSGESNLEEDCMFHITASVRSTVSIALTLFLTMFLAMMVTAPAQAATYPVAPYTTANLNYARNIQYYINYERHRYGRQTVYQSSCPAWFAMHWNYGLAQTGLFYHQSMYRILSTCHASAAGEVLARGNQSSRAVVTAWMNSPGHRAILMDGRYNKIGVDARYAAGVWTFAADFTR